jgi:hypothetical protein
MTKVALKVWCVVFNMLNNQYKYFSTNLHTFVKEMYSV